MEYRIINKGSSYDNIISSVTNIDSTESIIQSILPISSETLKEAFIHTGGDIRDFTDLKK